MITLSGGTASFKTALSDYQAAWKAFIVINHLEAFEHTLELTAISWKVEHKVALYANLRMLGDKAEQVHIGTINDRFIAMAILKEPYAGSRIIKILERRPRSHDPLGLDSVDYRVLDIDETFEALKSAGARVERQSNEVHDWVSLRFGKNHEFEAKFMDHSMIDFATRQLDAAKQSLT